MNLIDKIMLKSIIKKAVTGMNHEQKVEEIIDVLREACMQEWEETIPTVDNYLKERIVNPRLYQMDEKIKCMCLIGSNVDYFRTDFSGSRSHCVAKLHQELNRTGNVKWAKLIDISNGNLIAYL